MPENARKTLDVFPFHADLPPEEHQEGLKRLYEQQPGEKTMWYNRFMLYCSLGPKRSLQAAVKAEREKIQAMESSENGPEDQGGSSAPLYLDTKKLTVVKTAVPGSWNEACKQWRWVERARAYDRYTIEEIVQGYIGELYKGLASKEHRIWELNKMAVDLKQRMLQADMSGHEIAALAGRIQSIMRDIAHEMKTFDKQVAAVILTPQIEQIYASQFERDEYVSRIMLQELERERERS